MKKNILIFLLIAIPYIGINAQTNVVINVLDKTKGETNLYFQDWPIIRTAGFAETKDIREMQVTSDSTGVFVIETSGRPNLIVASLFKERESKQILITPGDTVTAVIDFMKNKKDRFEVVFYGKNEENYNAYYNLNKEFDRNTIMKMAESIESLEKYMQIIDSAYRSNTNRINTTLKLSVLRDLMLNEEKVRVFQYLHYKYSQPIVREKLTQQDFLNIKNKYFPNEKIACENPLYMKSVGYYLGMGSLSFFLRKDINAENRFKAEIDTIEKYFAGELKDYFLVDNFGRATNLYKKNKELNGTDVDNWYRDYRGKMKGDIYNKYIQYCYERYKILGNPFPENVLKEKIIQLSDSSVYTVGSFLEKQKGMQLIIDNWATWCGPCFVEMERGKENIQKLIEQGDRFIYISIDEARDFNKAKKKAIELGIIENAWLLSGGYKSEYAKYMNITSIPRFIMIDKNGYVKKLQMYNPSRISVFSDYKSQ